MCLLATGFRLLYLVVFALESAGHLLGGHCLFNKVLGPLFLVESCTKELSRAFNHGPCLRERRDFAFPSIFLVVSVRVKDGSHFDQLEVTLELRSQVRLRHFEPVRACAGLVILLARQRLA